MSQIRERRQDLEEPTTESSHNFRKYRSKITISTKTWMMCITDIVVVVKGNHFTNNMKD
jgi:hypothetical protein